MTWIDRLLKGLKKLLGLQVERARVRILEEYHADGISVFRIQDDSIPGWADLWRIDRHHERIKFFILVLNVRRLRSDLQQPGGDREAVAAVRGRSLVANLQRQLQEQAGVLATHYWITGWERTYNSIDPHGRSYQSARTYLVRALACDLQGVGGEFSGDRYSRRFARQIIKQLAASDFRELSHHRTWQAAVRSIDWAQWLTGLAQSKHGIDPEHCLQPQKPDRRRIGQTHRLGD